MARITRSQKVDIAEDDFALAVQLLLPNPPVQPQRALADMFHGANSLPVVDNGTAAEVKNLKAAYRAAIGIGKKPRKPRAKRNGHEELSTLDGSGESEVQTQPSSSDTSIHVSQAFSGDAPLVQTTKPRATRQQAAKQQQEGQLGNEVSVKTQDQLAAQRRADLSYITSLFGGRSTGQSRLFIRPVNFGRSITNDEIALEQDNLAQCLKQAISGGDDRTAPTVSITAPHKAISKVADAAVTQSIQSPSKTRSIKEIEEACAAQLPASPTEDATGGNEDSFCEQILSRSPAKPVSRIEDSVEALDQLEDALEALDQAASGKPVAAKKTQRTTQTLDLFKQLQKSTKQPTPKSGYATVRVKSTAPKQAPTLKRTISLNFGRAEINSQASEQGKITLVKTTSSKRPVSLLPPKGPVKSTKPLTRPAAFELPGEAISRKLKEQREARRAQRESSEDSLKDEQCVTKSRSSKPLTKPTFQLPGEAVSQKKREAFEARLKAQEEGERSRREFKARPLRMSTGPNTVPRDTVASRARQNKPGNENSVDGQAAGSKRSANIGAHRMSMAQLNVANVSTPRAPGPPAQLIRKSSTTTSTVSSSIPGHTQRTVSVHDVQLQRQRAKEIYNRDVFLTEDIERERKEREAAAKRAREEAAERGRQASREWAEKQRAKKMAEGDKGLAAGYGPGGQLGLQA